MASHPALQAIFHHWGEKLRKYEKLKNRFLKLPRSTRALLEQNFAPQLIFIPRRACLSRIRGIPDRQQASWPALRSSVQMEIRPVTRADLKLYSVIWRETLRIQSCAKLERACRVSAQTNFRTPTSRKPFFSIMAKKLREIEIL